MARILVYMLAVDLSYDDSGNDNNNNDDIESSILFIYEYTFLGEVWYV
jgi:hypothetical protein